MVALVGSLVWTPARGWVSASAGYGRDWRTAIFRVSPEALRNGLTGGTDLAVQAAQTRGGKDVTVWFVRLVKLGPR